jgi:mRNA interferase RelE/StbE
VYKVELRRSVQKSLEKIQTQERLKIIAALLELEQNPRPRGIEKIKGVELWRIREGDYRIVFSIDDSEKTITIVRIGHRRDIYRSL